MSFAWPAAEFVGTDTNLRSAWRRHGLAFVGVFAALLLLFRRDVTELANIWWTSTTYGHCLFVLPVLGWLVWQRREGLAQLRPVAWAPGLAVVAAGALGWLVGDAASAAIVRQFGLLLMIWGGVATILGPNVVRGLAFPLAWAVFLIPFGEDMEGPLQTLTANVSVAMLHLVGLEAQLDGVLIRTSFGFFEVAEACSGAKFVIAMLAFGTLAANVCFVSWRRRTAFMAAAVVVPVAANCIRAFGTMYAAHLTSVEAATGLDHIVYGWVFFAAVMAGVLAIGWRWFDRAPDDPVIDPARLQRTWPFMTDLRLAAGTTLALAATAAVLAASTAGRADALPLNPALPEVPGWHKAGLSRSAPWAPNYPGADRFLMQRYVDGRGRAVDLAVATYAGQHEGKELIAFGQGAIRENDSWVRIEDLPALDGGSALRMIAPGPVERTVVTWYRIGGMTTGSQRNAKVATVVAKFSNGPQSGTAVLLSAEGEQHAARAAITDFRAAMGQPGDLADRLTGAH